MRPGQPRRLIRPSPIGPPPPFEDPIPTPLSKSSLQAPRRTRIPDVPHGVRRSGHIRSFAGRSLSAPEGRAARGVAFDGRRCGSARDSRLPGGVRRWLSDDSMSYDPSVTDPAKACRGQPGRRSSSTGRLRTPGSPALCPSPTLTSLRTRTSLVAATATRTIENDASHGTAARPTPTGGLADRLRAGRARPERPPCADLSSTDGESP